MQNLDFTSMMEKYPLLSIKDISFLNKFFNSEEVKKILLEIETNKQNILSSGIKTFLILSGLFSIFIIWINFSQEFNFSDFFIQLIIAIIIALLISLLVIGLRYLFGKKAKPIKNLLMPLFVSKINLDFSYTPKTTYYKESINKLSSIGLIENYARIDNHEDSIEYSIKSGEEQLIDIFGSEVITSKKVKIKNGHRYVKNNHFYILKVIFNNPKYKIKVPIKLIEDVNDNHIKKILKVLLIQFGIIGGFLALISGDENSDGFLPEFLELVGNNKEITTVFLFGMFFIIYFIYGYLKGNGRVKVENIEFEKEFDIYSDDQIESRRLLTPSFMYRLVDFVNKISRKRVYELYFHDNYFYLKYNIMATNSFVNLNGFGSSSYLEFSPYKSIYKNVEKIVEFYLEIKNITQLSKDLKLFYYDKGMMSKELIKGGDVNIKSDTNNKTNNKNFIFF